MARFYGVVGYGEPKETPPNSGIYVDKIKEVKYFGDVVRDTSRLVPGDQLNDDINVNNNISIVADEYAILNFSLIKYVGWSGVLWTVTSVESKPPRLILSLGKVYNGPTA